MARDVNQRIIEDDEALPQLTRASQNIAATVALLRGLSRPATLEDRRAHHEIRTLLERAAAQQAESSAPASVRPQSDPTGMCQSAKRSKAAGRVPLSRCMSVSATTVTHGTPSTPVGVPVAMQGRELAMATTLVMADGTTMARTEARAPAY